MTAKPNTIQIPIFTLQYLDFRTLLYIFVQVHFKYIYKRKLFCLIYITKWPTERTYSCFMVLRKNAVHYLKIILKY